MQRKLEYRSLNSKIYSDEKGIWYYAIPEKENETITVFLTRNEKEWTASVRKYNLVTKKESWESPFLLNFNACLKLYNFFGATPENIDKNKFVKETSKMSVSDLEKLAQYQKEILFED